MDILPALQAAGVTVRRVDREQRVRDDKVDAILDLALGKVRARFAVEEKRRAPYPNELPKLKPIQKYLAELGTPMLVVPFVSEPLASSLTQAGWSWADTTGNFDLRSDHLVLRQRSGVKPPRPKTSRIPQGSGSLAIIRALIGFPRGAGEEHGATALANQVGVSQPRASQVLHKLLDLKLVARTPQGQWMPDREALLDSFLSEYRGPKGSVRYLYSLDPPNEVAVRAAEVSKSNQFAVSADVGPDLVLAWRRPSVVIIYVHQLLDLDRLGLVDAQARHDANVIVRAPDDVSVFPTPPFVANMRGVEIPLADATQQVWDLQDLGGADRLEAAGRLRDWLLNRP